MSQLFWTAVAAFFFGCMVVLAAWLTVENRRLSKLKSISVDVLSEGEYNSYRKNRIGPPARRVVTIHHYLDDGTREVIFERNGTPKSYFTRPSPASMRRLNRLFRYANQVDVATFLDGEAPHHEQRWSFPTPLPLKESEPS